MEKFPIWALNPPRKAIFLHKNQKKVRKSLQIRELMPIFAPKNVTPARWNGCVTYETNTKHYINITYKYSKLRTKIENK